MKTYDCGCVGGAFQMCPLHAAAPELLAMLKAANAAFFGVGTRMELLKALKDSKALIAKAEGRNVR